MKNFKVFVFLCLCCASNFIMAQQSVPVVNLAKAWSSEPQVMNISKMTNSVSYNVIEQPIVYESAGKIESSKDYVLFKQSLYYGENLKNQYTYNNGDFTDNGIIQKDNNIMYYQLSGGKMLIYDIKGNIIKNISIPAWINKVVPISGNRIMAYRTRNIEITDDGLTEFCIIDIETNKIIFTHHSISKEDATSNKLWFPLMNNHAWTYIGKIFFYENVSNNIYEITEDKNGKFSLTKRLNIDMSPLSIDYPQTKSISPEDYKMGSSLHITDIKEMSGCIVFKTVINSEMKQLALMKDNGNVINIKNINPDIDNIVNGKDIIPFSALNKQQQEKLMIKAVDTRNEKNIFIVPVYE